MRHANRTQKMRAKKKGEIFMIAPGVYSSREISQADEYYYVISNKYPKAVVSGISAISYHLLSEADDDFIHLDVPVGKTHLRKNKMFIFHRVVPKRLCGIQKIERNGFKFRIYSPERCLFEAFLIDKDGPLFPIVLKNYIKRFKLNFDEIFKLEKRLGIKISKFLKFLLVESSS